MNRPDRGRLQHLAHGHGSLRRDQRLGRYGRRLETWAAWVALGQAFKRAAARASNGFDRSYAARNGSAGSRLMTVLITAVVSVTCTLLVVFVLVNLRSAERRIEYRVAPRYAVTEAAFARSMSSLPGPGLLPGNRVRELVNGDQFFPAMLEAIRGAQRSITFETYIYWSGGIGREFTDALIERARAGVRVHLLFDWVGSMKMDEGYVREMRRAGVQVQQYHPLRWHTVRKLKHRTHRKVLVVDGRIGFTGGAGIADEWLGDARSEKEWRETQFQLEGPAVAQMQSAFMDNWLKTWPEVLLGDAYFPPLAEAGPSLVQVYKSSPREGSESVRLMYLLSIAAARQSILLSTAYFVPDQRAIEMLVEARGRGVRVEVVVPSGKTDIPLARLASRALWGPLLEAGVEIYEFQPSMYHCKVMVVDERWVSAGSTNFDNRSWRFNDEVNMNVLDAEFARRQVEIFERDKARSRRIGLEEWRHRPSWEKAIDSAARLLRMQL